MQNKFKNKKFIRVDNLFLIVKLAISEQNIKYKTKFYKIQNKTFISFKDKLYNIFI